MNVNQVNGEAKQSLEACKGLCELRDEAGKLVGYFLPPMSQKELQLYLLVLSEYDPAETRRRVQDEHGKGKTTQEVLARLQAVKESSCVTP